MGTHSPSQLQDPPVHSVPASMGRQVLLPTRAWHSPQEGTRRSDNVARVLPWGLVPTLKSSREGSTSWRSVRGHDWVGGLGGQCRLCELSGWDLCCQGGAGGRLQHSIPGTISAHTMHRKESRS